MGARVSQAQPIRLLLVEDEFLISEMVAEDLSEQGFVVSAVANASDALSHLASAAVDILFTDVKLPGGIDGMTLARRAREMRPDLPVVYASGHVNKFDLDDTKPRLLTLGLGYHYLPQANGGAATNRMLPVLTARFPVTKRLLLTDRNRFDLDWKSGGFFWRYPV